MKITNAVVLAVVACFITVVAALVVVFLADPDAAADFMAQLLPYAGTTVALIAGLASVTRKQDEARERLDEVKRDVTYLANGGMDAKVIAGVADALPDHLLDPDAADKIAEARAKREAGPTP